MGLITALVTGTIVGIRHSFEADHIAALATLVDGEEDSGHPGIIGTSWGIGHAAPIVAVGLAFLVVRAQVPETVTALFGAFAGVVLVYLGVRTLRSARVTEHTHGGSTHAHVHVGPFSIGTTHSHRYGESLVVGIVHGLAGSGVLIVFLSTAAPSAIASLALLLAFAVASIVTMAALSIVWDRVLATGLQRKLQIGAGLASLVIGTLLVAHELFGFGIGHEHDAGHDHGADHEHGTDGGHEHGADADHEHALAVLDATTDQLGVAIDVLLSLG